MPRGKNKNKRKRTGREILSTPEKKGTGIKRERMGLATPSHTHTLVVVRKGTLVAMPELFNFALGEEVEGYEIVESDPD